MILSAVIVPAEAVSEVSSVGIVLLTAAAGVTVAGDTGQPDGLAELPTDDLVIGENEQRL